MLESSDGVADLVTKDTMTFLKEAESAECLSEYPPHACARRQWFRCFPCTGAQLR